jgi:hypothetical protein
MRMASIPPLPGLTILAAHATWSYTMPTIRYGKLTVVPQLFQIRVSFFLYGCWTSGVRMRMASIATLPELTIFAALTPPGATPCPLNTFSIFKDKMSFRSHKTVGLNVF